MKIASWKPDIGWKWFKWTFGFWHDPVNHTLIRYRHRPTRNCVEIRRIPTMKDVMWCILILIAGALLWASLWMGTVLKGN